MCHYIQTRVALVLALTLIVVVPVAAQENEITPCGEENISGIVVAMDEETRVVTVDTDDGLCTVTLDGDYGHSISALLGSYVDGTSAESLAAALETTRASREGQRRPQQIEERPMRNSIQTKVVLLLTLALTLKVIGPVSAQDDENTPLLMPY